MPLLRPPELTTIRRPDRDWTGTRQRSVSDLGFERGGRSGEAEDRDRGALAHVVPVERDGQRRSRPPSGFAVDDVADEPAAARVRELDDGRDERQRVGDGGITAWRMTVNE